MQTTRIEMVDDLDGEPGDDVTTHTFAVDGDSYEIDLCQKNGLLFGEAFEDFIACARRVGKPYATTRKAAASQSTGELHREARAWAIASGINVSARGRVPLSIIAQYEAA